MVTLAKAFCLMREIGLDPIIDGDELSYSVPDRGWGIGRMFVARVHKGLVSVNQINSQLRQYGNGTMRVGK